MVWKHCNLLFNKPYSSQEHNSFCVLTSNLFWLSSYFEKGFELKECSSNTPSNSPRRQMLRVERRKTEQEMKSNIIPLRTLSATSQVTPTAENQSSSLINFLWYPKQGNLQGIGIYRPKKRVQIRKNQKKNVTITDI